MLFISFYCFPCRKKWFILVYFSYGNLLALDTTFQNYTAFFILVIFVMFKPKYKLMTLLMYIADIIFIASFRHKTPSHLIIHALNCFCFYFVISKSFTLIPHKKLNLLPDEIRILNELASGKNQNEIEFFSPNTVCSKMKKARIRNGFNTNDELILFFIKENSIEEIK